MIQLADRGLQALVRDHISAQHFSEVHQDILDDGVLYCHKYAGRLTLHRAADPRDLGSDLALGVGQSES